MLANPPTAPRPRPPAQLRRSTSMKGGSSPPPPYVSSLISPSRSSPLETLLGSPVSATMQMVRRETESSSPGPSSPQETFDWLNERSRDEMSELLLKADSLIKKRENDLDQSASFCKTLYDENRALQNKHQALLSRFPSTPSRPNSVSLSPAGTPLTHTPSHSISETPSPIPLHLRRHTRKISVSPEDICLLSDQNAELLSKVEKLEAESNQADASGRRMLKKLEKDISLLRRELEDTQAKNAELEEKTKDSFFVDPGRIAEEIMKKKDERELKAQALRAKSQWVDDQEQPIRDFAPGGPWSYSSPPPKLQESAFSACLFSELPRTPSSKNKHLDLWTPTPRHRTASISEPQLSIISQLLQKIQELEDANAHIVEEQLATANRLQAVQRETENMSKMYECLTDTDGDIRLEFVDESPEKPVPDGNTIRFRSFKRTLEGDMKKPDQIEDINLSAMNLTGVRKTRKSVMGLFGERNLSLSPSPSSSNLAVPFPVRHSTHPGHSDASAVTSPTLSTLSFNLNFDSTGTSHATSPEMSPFLSAEGNTLQNELGNEYGEEWSFNAGNHHFRSSSLYDLSLLQMEGSPSPSSSPSPHLHRPLHKQNVDIQNPPSLGQKGALQLTLEPPTPPQHDSSSVGKHTARYRKMSQTVKSRTGRWVDGRFTDNVLSPTTKMKNDLPPASSSAKSSTMPARVPRRLASALELVTEKFTGRVTPVPLPAEGEEEKRGIELFVEGSSEKTATRVDPGAKGFVGIVLEVWLWLQFIIIILVFVWAMAKKGPKSVLGDSAHRRTLAKQ